MQHVKSMNSLAISFLVDSRASWSVIDLSVYKALVRECAMGLGPEQDIVILADGSDLTTYGEVRVELQMEE